MKFEINIERNESISDTIESALMVFLSEHLNFHGKLHTAGAGEWIYQTAKQIMDEKDRLNGQSLDDLQNELDGVMRSEEWQEESQTESQEDNDSDEIHCETEKAVETPSDWNLQTFVFKKLSEKSSFFADKIMATRNWRRKDNSIFFEVVDDFEFSEFVRLREIFRREFSEIFGVEVDFFVTLKKKENARFKIENLNIPKNLASLMNPATWQRGAKDESEKKPLPVLDALKNLPEYKNSRPISENFSEKN